MSAANPTVRFGLVVALLLVTAAPALADARTHGRHAASRATTGQAGRQAVNDEHAGTASEQIDKVLDSKIKNICRGC
ncbi:MAG: hypothetical protein P4M07_12510 [Xanthobacteraceae bacterium]|nr:hypothetical protein [Xanthobacteraceae bacterium]